MSVISAQPLSNRVHGFAFGVIISNLRDFLSRQVSFVAGPGFRPQLFDIVKHVLNKAHPLKITGAVVHLIAVDMVDRVAPLIARAKRSGDNAMEFALDASANNRKVAFLSPVTRTERHANIAVTVEAGLQEAARSLDATKRANFVTGELGNSPPFFINHNADHHMMDSVTQGVLYEL